MRYERAIEKVSWGRLGGRWAGKPQRILRLMGNTELQRPLGTRACWQEHLEHVGKM